MVFVVTCICVVTPGISAELAGIEILVKSLGISLPVVSVLSVYGFKITEVDCVQIWKPALVLWFDF